MPACRTHLKKNFSLVAGNVYVKAGYSIINQILLVSMTSVEVIVKSKCYLLTGCVLAGISKLILRNFHFQAAGQLY